MRYSLSVSVYSASPATARATHTATQRKPLESAHATAYQWHRRTHSPGTMARYGVIIPVTRRRQKNKKAPKGLHWGFGHLIEPTASVGFHLCRCPGCRAARWWKRPFRDCGDHFSNTRGCRHADELHPQRTCKTQRCSRHQRHCRRDQSTHLTSPATNNRHSRRQH